MDLEKEILKDYNRTFYSELQVQPEGLPAEMQPGDQSVSPAEFATGMADTAAAGIKGATQGFVGLPGDLESIARLLLNKMGMDVSPDSALPTTEDVASFLDKYLPMKPVSELSTEDLKTAEMLGEFAAPGGYVKGAKTVAKTAKKVGRKALATGAAATTMTKSAQGAK